MRIAIIGSGISGLAAALGLSEKHDVYLIEKADRFGGHSRTLEVGAQAGSNDGTFVDTGFIVFNEPNYPLLTRLFNWLGVEPTPSCMSFGVSINQCKLEYGTRGLGALFAQPLNLLRPAFWRMLADIFRFNKKALQYLDSNLSLGQCLDELKVGSWFRDYYLLAMGAAIWSAPPAQMLNYPARSFIRFFQNHGLLDPSLQIQWFSLRGGSQSYVNAILEKLPQQNLLLNTHIMDIERSSDGVLIRFEDGSEQRFEALILACHSDQSLALLGDRASKHEREILGAIRYQENEVILHRDISFMPRRRNCWQSWVYLMESSSSGEPRVSLTYWMNNLQKLASDSPLLVTLNPQKKPPQDKIIDRWITQHPIFDEPAVQAQQLLSGIQGSQNTFFCGAWAGYGFHEDGLRSAMDVCRRLDVEPSWAVV